MGAVDDYNEQIEEYNRTVEDHNSDIDHLRRRHPWALLVASLAVGALMACMGNLFSWGWQHHEPQVMWFSAGAVVATLVAFFAGKL